jgi:hypothetical protein
LLIATEFVARLGPVSEGQSRLRTSIVRVVKFSVAYKPSEKLKWL